MISRLVNLIIIIGVPIFFLALSLWLSPLWFHPGSVIAEGICSDTTKWGMHTNNEYNPAGLIVRTQEENGASIGHVNWTISTIDTDGGGPDRAGWSILHTSLPDPNDDGWYNNLTFRTGNGNRNTDNTELLGRFWCHRDKGNYYDSYNGYTVLGFGTENNYGNQYDLACKEYYNRCDDCMDSSNWEEFTVSASLPSGRSGYWTASMSGQRSGNVNNFTVTNGTTTRVTFTWHDNPDLVMRNASGGTSPAISGSTTVVVNHNATYTAKTRNAGDGSSGASTTRAWTSGSSNNSDDFAVGALSPDTNSSQHSFTTSWATVGTKTVSFKADNPGVIDESNNNNNTVSINVTVIAPDLSLQSVTATPNPNALHVTDTLTVTAYVRNISNYNVGAFTIQFCQNGNSYFLPAGCPTGWQTVNVASLAANTPAAPAIFTTPPLPSAASYPATYNYVVRVDLPVGAAPGNVVESNEINNNWLTQTYTVIGPPPWFQTGSGDVGSHGAISPRHAPPVGSFNTDYLAISDNPTICPNFRSVRGWLVKKYSDYGDINVEPALVGGSIYQALFDKYANKSEGTATSPPNDLNQGQIVSVVGNDGGVMVWQGDISGGHLNNYNKGPTVIFVDGNMTVNSDMEVASDTGLIFVIRGNLTIGQNVGIVQSMFIFDRNFTSQSRNNNTERQLILNGAAIGGFNGGSFALNRDFRSVRSSTDPVELFTYEPKYLWIFRDIIGDAKLIYLEVAP